MRKILAILAIICSLIVCAQVSNNSIYSRKGTIFVEAKQSDRNTGYTWQDKKGYVYPIYVSTNGRCFIYKISEKTGKQYKSYLPEDISRTICAELGIQYSPKK